MEGLAFCELVDDVGEDEEGFVDVTCFAKSVLSVLKLAQALGTSKIDEVEHGGGFGRLVFALGDSFDVDSEDSVRSGGVFVDAGLFVDSVLFTKVHENNGLLESPDLLSFQSLDGNAKSGVFL